MSDSKKVSMLSFYESFIAATGKHRKNKDEEKEHRHRCKYCDYTTYFSSDIKSHKLLHNDDSCRANLVYDATREAEKIVAESEESLCFYKCAKCGFWTTKWYKFEIHKRKHLHNCFLCLHCYYGANSKKSMKRHFKFCKKRKMTFKFEN